MSILLARSFRLSESRRMRKIKVTVTEDDIANGAANNRMKCPVALACAREDIDEPEFEIPGLNYYAGHRHMTVKLPKAACDFATAFDDGKPVVPFEFEFELAETYDE